MFYWFLMQQSVPRPGNPVLLVLFSLISGHAINAGPVKQMGLLEKQESIVIIEGDSH
jgi:hypothetical protein